MIKKFIYSVFFVCLIFAFTGCGGKGSDAPAGSTVTISGIDSFADGTGLFSIQTGRLFIVVENAKGVPLNNVKLNITFPLARTSIVTTLFNDPANLGGYLVLLQDEGSDTNSPLEVTTDINGVYELVFKFWSGGIAYTSDVHVTTGTADAVHEFAVTSS